MGKGKARGSKTPLERAEMHAEAFVQVAAGWCLVCGSAVRWRSALGAPLHRCSAPAVLFTVRGHSAKRFLGAPLGDARFVRVSSFR